MKTYAQGEKYVYVMKRYVRKMREMRIRNEEMCAQEEKSAVGDGGADMRERDGCCNENRNTCCTRRFYRT